MSSNYTKVLVSINLKSALSFPVKCNTIRSNGSIEEWIDVEAGQEFTFQFSVGEIFLFTKGENKEPVFLYEPKEGDHEISIHELSEQELSEINRRLNVRYEICLFPSYGVSPLDCAQGSVGDCWLHQGIAAAAHDFPNEIQSLFYPQEINPLGFYVVKLYSSMVKDYVYILIDDYLPMSEGTPKYAKFTNHFSKHKEQGTWVCLLEKAYSKLVGGLLNLEGGKCSPEHCHIAIERFLGGKGDYYEFLDDQNQPIFSAY
jgi:hypothetical protein